MSGALPSAWAGFILHSPLEVARCARLAHWGLSNDIRLSDIFKSCYIIKGVRHAKAVRQEAENTSLENSFSSPEIPKVAYSCSLFSHIHAHHSSGLLAQVGLDRAQQAYWSKCTAIPTREDALGLAQPAWSTCHTCCSRLWITLVYGAAKQDTKCRK